MAEPRQAAWPVVQHLRRATADRRVAFVVVGGFNTLVGFAWFVGYQLTFQALGLGRFDYLLSLICAQASSTVTSFLTQRRFVFKVRGHFWRDLARFATVSTSAFAANLVLLPFCVEVLGLLAIPAQMLSTLLVALASYFAHRDFSFHRTDNAATNGAEPVDHAPQVSDLQP